MVTPVEPAELPRALVTALDGGPAVAPLPTDRVERAAALAMLHPDVPVETSHVAAIVATSGSTGRPKGVVLSRDAIVASTEATHKRLGGPGNWLLALPTHYVAGFMVTARAIVAGTSCVEVGRDLTGLPDAVRQARRPSYLSVVATQLTRALDNPSIASALAAVHTVLLGGGPAPAGLVDRARGFGIRVVTTYGMSETCGGCVYDGLPLDGVGVQLDERGAVTITGPIVFSGYRLRPDLTAEVLSAGRFWTRDRARWCGERLEILGRLDDVVISGGLNVDLGAVERASTAWAERRSATVAMVGVPDPDWGTVVVAVTDAPAPDPDPKSSPSRESGPEGLAELRSVLAESLPAHALPKRLVHRDTIPRTAGGKIDRHRLRTELALTSADSEGSE